MPSGKIAVRGSSNFKLMVWFMNFSCSQYLQCLWFTKNAIFLILGACYWVRSCSTIHYWKKWWNRFRISMIKVLVFKKCLTESTNKVGTKNRTKERVILIQKVCFFKWPKKHVMKLLEKIFTTPWLSLKDLT